MGKMFAVECKVKREVIGQYRGYEIIHAEQVDYYTEEPFIDGSGSKWYEMVNHSTGDKIITNIRSSVEPHIDYELKKQKRRRVA